MSEYDVITPVEFQNSFGVGAVASSNYPTIQIPRRVITPMPPTGTDGETANGWLRQFSTYLQWSALPPNEQVPGLAHCIDWYWRQHEAYTTSQLEPWKLQLLQQAGIDFLQRNPSQPTSNRGYAIALVRFYAVHGHYAVSLEQCHPSLVRWVHLMRDSNGTSGVPGQPPSSATLAHEYVTGNIPEFTYAKAAPPELASIAFTGITPKPPRQRVKGRKAEVLDRISKSGRFPMSQWGSKQALFDGDICPPLHYLALQKICRRAQGFCQTLRATYQLDSCSSESAQTWWLIDVLDLTEPTGHGDLRLCLRRIGQTPDAVENFTTPSIVDIESSGYTQDGGQFAVNLTCKDGSLVRLDYDAILADESHPNVRPFGGLGDFGPLQHCIAGFDWYEWLSGDTVPERHASTTSTANRCFVENIIALQQWVEQHPDKKQIHWSVSGVHYRFIEHMLLKRSTGGLSFSHAERLCSLNFTFGESAITPTELFGPSA